MWMIFVGIGAAWILMHMRKVRYTQAMVTRFRKGPRAVFR
jgi:hypothetical protein